MPSYYVLTIGCTATGFPLLRSYKPAREPGVRALWKLNRMNKKAELISVLSGIAWYNDQGYIRSSHSRERVAVERATAQEAISSLVNEIGEAAISPELLTLLASGAAVADSSGEVVCLAKEEFSVPEGSNNSLQARRP
mgnify:CR=1 FL=1